jgi:hypothetical protein
MPILPENRAKYPADWKAISRRIRFERAGNRCEVCGAEKAKPSGKLKRGATGESTDANRTFNFGKERFHEYEHTKQDELGFGLLLHRMDCSDGFCDEVLHGHCFERRFYEITHDQKIKVTK